MIIFKDLVQGTDEWKKIRKGVITGTKLKAISSKETSETYKGQLYELIAEDTGEIPEIRQNDAMIRGTELEPEARFKFQEKTGFLVEEVGFCKHNEYDWLGLSPDGLIKSPEEKYTKGVEIKCPGAKKHVAYMLDGGIPDEYYWQIVNYFLVNEDLEELYFVSYNPDMYLEKLKMHIVTVKREDFEKDLKDIMEKLLKFRETWEKSINKLIF